MITSNTDNEPMMFVTTLMRMAGISIGTLTRQKRCQLLAPSIRAAVCERLSWLGAKIDPHANARNDRVLDAGDGIALRMIRTDEEQVIAESAAALLFRGS